MEQALLLVALVVVSGSCSLTAGNDVSDQSIDLGSERTVQPTVARPRSTPSPADSASATPTADPPTESETPIAEPSAFADVAYPSKEEIQAQGAASLCEFAGDAFCVDSNGNLYPDFVEEAAGYDPRVDECLEADCGGVDLEDFFATLQDNTLFILDPIAASLDAAGAVLQGAVEADAADGIEGAANRIILISDGIETCGGDPVASAQALTAQVLRW